MKAIQTFYKGYHFRSRLEARWAVFFDTLDWQWEYEFEGFQLPSGYYLPDFYFPEIKAFAEVKADVFTAEERLKCLELRRSSKADVFLLAGIPDFKTIECIDWYPNGDSDDVILVAKGAKYYPYHFGSWYYDSHPEDIGEHFPGTYHAINAARAARFEHGENKSF